MLVMTAKVNIKKIIIVLAAAAGVILGLILLLGGGDSAQTAAPAVSSNDGRVKFLKDFGWDVSTSPTESGQVRIPEETTEVYERYNALQKSQGYDLANTREKVSCAMSTRSTITPALPIRSMPRCWCIKTGSSAGTSPTPA